MKNRWKLLDRKDISISKWFPVEQRRYKLASGRIVDDFMVTTLADVAMVVAVTPEEKIVMVEQFKPGFGEVMLEFPAGRREENDESIEETAKHELEEETGIRTDRMEFMGIFSGFVTKATEKVYCYLVEGAEFNAKQKLDENEDIEVVTFSYEEVEKLINNNQIKAAITVAAWDLAKRKFRYRFSTWKYQ